MRNAVPDGSPLRIRSRGEPDRFAGCAQVLPAVCVSPGRAEGHGASGQSAASVTGAPPASNASSVTASYSLSTVIGHS